MILEQIGEFLAGIIKTIVASPDPVATARVMAERGAEEAARQRAFDEAMRKAKP